MVLVVCGSLSLAGAALADAVVDWNVIASQAIPAHPPPPGASAGLDFAMVHAAIYDAVEAIDGRFEPYAVEIPGPPAHRRRPPPRPRTMCSSIASRRRPRPWTRLTTTTWPAMAWRRMTLGWPWASWPRPVSSPCGPMTGAGRPARKFSSAAPPPESGVRRPYRPSRRWRCHPGWPTVTPFTLKSPDSVPSPAAARFEQPSNTPRTITR